MRIFILASVLMSIAGAYGVAFSPGVINVRKEANQKKLEGDVDRDRAIKIAQEHAAKTNVDPSRYEATGCPVSSQWRVYLEPASGQNLNEVLEYAITEKQGFVLTTTRLAGAKTRNTGGPVTQDDAVAIARKDAVRKPGFSKKQLTVCELKNFWRIIYSPPAHIEGGGREYLIDKATGAITDKKYYQ